MPELPEVETTRAGLAPRMLGRRIDTMVVRDRRLRWPLAPDLEVSVEGQTVRALRRRAKYLIIDLDRGSLIVHLGMSGSLRMLGNAAPAERHDHVDLRLDDGAVVRFTDPRRFGSMHFTLASPLAHPLLASCGPEPLSDIFDGDHLHRMARGRAVAVKDFLMMGHVVAGVGNIYANEALFRSGIHPRRAAGRISRERYARLANAVKATLRDALAAGGSSLRDWSHADGTTGYFQQAYFVYDRAGAPCKRCSQSIRVIRQGQRSTFFCPICQR